MQCICNAAIYYADLTHQKLQDTGYYEDNSPFKISDEVSFSCELFIHFSNKLDKHLIYILFLFLIFYEITQVLLLLIQSN